MRAQLSDKARNVLETAEVEARALNHTYIGTEHLLLALIRDDSTLIVNLLSQLCIDLAAVRRQIENFVQHGEVSPGSEKALPLTPRAKQAIELAHEEAMSVHQRSVDVEHLFLGLLREPDGVASIVLRRLGARPEETRAEALKFRLKLMKIVERAVRPVRAGTPFKRRMREELMAHLTAIYDDELLRHESPSAALDEAARRFGDPAQLSGELQSALSWHERISYIAERFVAYRAPESAAHFSLRMAVRTFALLATILGAVLLGIFLGYGAIEDVRTLARMFAAIILLTPIAQFVVWLAYIKMRDAEWGAFGSRKSAGRALVYAFAIAIASDLYCLSVAGIARWDAVAAIEALRLGGLIGVISAVLLLGLAYLSGPGEIRDTQWALLDLETA
jgi:ATP-dependent Clp protease ATP-binding subunit ClpC